MKMQLAIICALIGFAAFAKGTATYRDSLGCLQGTATTDSSGRVTYRDAQRRLQATKKVDGVKTSIFRLVDPLGKTAQLVAFRV